MHLEEWLRRDLPPVDYIVAPWLSLGGIAMIYGPRGVSKTNVGMGLALAIAQGEPFLGFEVPRARRVLYMDGEMQRNLVQDRLRKFCAHTPRPRALRNLDYVNYADLERGIGDLSAEGRGRATIEAMINMHDADVLMLDNKSSLIRAGDENSAESWQSFNDWILSLRRFNVTTILYHHSGKRGPDGTIRQRGTSRAEDVLDVVVQLDKAGKPQAGVIPVQWTFEKYRSFTPEEESFVLSVRYDDEAGIAWLETGDSTYKDPPPWFEQARELKQQGLPVREIADRVGVSKSAVARWLPGRPLGGLA